MAFNRRKFNKISTTEELEKFILNMGVDKFPWGELRDVHPRTMITEDFIRKYKDYIDWDDIWYGECTEQFIREFEDKVNWRQVTYHADKFSLDFIRTYKDKLNWTSLSMQGMGDSFYEEFIDYVNWEYFKSPNVSEDFIRKYKDKIDWNPLHLNVGSIMSNKSSKFLWEMRDYIQDWDQVLRYNKHYVEFAMEHKDIVLANRSRFADYLPLPDNATDEFIEAFSDHINWYTVFCQKDFDPKFALKHLDKLPRIAGSLNDYHMKQFIKMIDELPDNEYTNKIKKVLDMEVDYDYLVENDMFEDTYYEDDDGDELNAEDAFVETYGDEKKYTVRYLMLDSYKQDPPIDESFAVTIFDNIYSFED